VFTSQYREKLGGEHGFVGKAANRVECQICNEGNLALNCLDKYLFYLLICLSVFSLILKERNVTAAIGLQISIYIR
jgi:hypothetical protein